MTHASTHIIVTADAPLTWQHCEPHSWLVCTRCKQKLQRGTVASATLTSQMHLHLMWLVLLLTWMCG